jgi:hypothetical protein
LSLHPQLKEIQPDEVEVEARQVLRRARGDARMTHEPSGARVVADLEPVALDVVAAVAVEREVAVADPCRPGAVRDVGLRGGARGQAERDERASGRNGGAQPSFPGAHVPLEAST